MKKSSCNRKILGIIGGMGPRSDLAFLEMLQSRISAKCDGDYIPVIYDGNCCRPDRSDYLTGKSGRCPGNSLLGSLKNLEKCGATVIVMPCNTAHYWSFLIRKNKRRKTVFIDMISAVTNYCKSRNLKKVTLLATAGTYEKDIYRKALLSAGIECVYPDDETRKSASDVISDIKCGKKADLDCEDACFSENSCDGIILGCTELCLADKKQDDSVYIDCLSVLADKVVETFGKKIR